MNSTKMNKKINKSLQNEYITSKRMNKLLKYYTKMTDEQQEKFDYLRDDQFMHCSSCNIIFDTYTPFSLTIHWDRCGQCRKESSPEWQSVGHLLDINKN